MTKESQWHLDRALVQRTLAGDQDAIAALVTRMKCIPSFLNAFNRDRHQILSSEKLEDAAQETAARVWRDRTLFGGTSLLETWVYPYAKHVFLESIAAQSKRDYRRADHDAIHSLQAGGPTVSDALEAGTEAARVRRAMNSMDQELVLLIEQHLQLGYSFAKIAEQGGTNINTVKARYYRGIKALRNELDRSPSRPERQA